MYLLGVCDTEYAHNTALKIGTALVNYYVPLAVMAVLYSRIFVAIRRRSKLEIWQNSIMMTGGGRTTSSDNSSAETSRKLLGSIKDEDGYRESGAEEISRIEDDGVCTHQKTESQQTPSIVVDRVQSQTMSHSQTGDRGASLTGLDTDEIESAPVSKLEENALSPVVGSRKCVRFLLVKQSESDSNDVDIDHIEMWSIEPSHCEMTTSDDSGLPARLMHRLRQRNRRGRRRRRNGQKQNSVASDVKAAKQLGVIMGAFFICFFPYFVCFVVVAVCRSCVSDVLMITVTWIGYINSTLNPFLYPLCNQQFRISFRRMFASVHQVGTTVRGLSASSV